MTPRQTVTCPGCGQDVHPRAAECRHCGFRAEITGLHELLSSLSTICSILVGFGLASLVSLATADADRGRSIPANLAGVCWLVSSLLLLVVMLLADLFRRQEVAENVIDLPEPVQQQLKRRCDRLLWVFTWALGGTALGVVFLGFHFSLVHGGLSVVAVLVCIGVGSWVLR